MKASEMIALDGSSGEGGGQVLRTALSLSLITGKPFRISNIRAKRPKPGLLRQHLTAVLAAQRIGSAAVQGAEIGSTTLTFEPAGLEAGDYHFAMGSAGSTTLVLQTLLPALLRAGAPSTVTLEGGTHNPFAPPFEFLARAFLPVLRRMGATVEAQLERPGFYPAGGGRLCIQVTPGTLGALELTQRGALRGLRTTALLCNLSPSIGRRELETLHQALGWSEHRGEVVSVRGPGPGNALIAELEFEQVTEVVVGLGEKGVRAEAVAEGVAASVRAYLAVDAPVGQHLADQLLLPMAMSSGGVFRTSEPSGHTRTQVETLAHFLPCSTHLGPLEGGAWEVRVAP